MNIGYYPGCALHGSSNDYEQSVRACLGALGVNLCELDDWICCGATAAHSLNHRLAVALPARNLAIAERDGYDDLLAPCPMCSAQLIKAGSALTRNRALREEITATVELPVTGRTSVLNIIQVFQRIGLERLKNRVVRELSEFKPACYYGCLLVRAEKGAGPPLRNGPSGTSHKTNLNPFPHDDCEHPTSMETVLSALGAAPVEWNFKTECCGAGMTLCNEQTVLDLSHKIVSNAAAHGANCLVVACPMCHVNLDMKQADIERRYRVRHGMKVYYLSDLVGMALGLHENQLGVNRHFVAAP